MTRFLLTADAETGRGFGRASSRAVGDEDRVAGVTRGVVHLHRTEARIGQQPEGHLLTPTGPKPGTALRKGHGHTVQQADGIRHRCDWVADVVLQVAGDARLVHEEGASRLQDRLDGAEHLERPGLVVYSVENERGTERSVRGQ